MVLPSLERSIQIHRFSAGIATLGSPKELIPAMGAEIPLLFRRDPFLRAQLRSRRSCPEDNLLADLHGKILDEVAREALTLVATFVSPFLRTGSHPALLAKLESTIGEAAVAGYFFRRAPVNRAQSFLELPVIFPVSRQYGAHPTIEATGGQQIPVDHGRLLSYRTLRACRSLTTICGCPKK
jgi:hypothetical protein